MTPGTNPSAGGTPATVSDLQALQLASQGNWRLDPSGSSADFYVKHFWGAITVHGRFEHLEGEGAVSPDGTVTGVLRLDAASLSTKNKMRDKHLRSADFFDTDHHPTVTITVARLSAGPDGALASEISLDIAGRSQQIRPVVQVVEAGGGSVSLRAELGIDRTAFDMTWSPLKMAAREARAVVIARFVRA
jgi:polyisoprenoid-binding protein YceI